MRQQTRASKEPAEKVVQDIRRATRKHYSAEEKIRIHAGDRRPVIAFALCRIGASGFFILSQSRERPER